MNRTKKFFFIAAALMLLAGCAKDPAGSGPGEGIPMGIEASLAGSKASITTDDLQEFWLQVDCAGDAAYSYFVNIVKSATGWSADKPLRWKDETAATSYCAAFFSGHNFTQSEFVGGADLIVPTDQSTQAGLNAADLLTLKLGSTSYEATTDGVLPVALSHGLAKVNFVLSLGEDFYINRHGRTDNPVSAFTVGGTCLSFHFKPATGAVSAWADSEDNVLAFPLSYTPGTVDNRVSVATFEAILVPQTLAAGVLSVSFSVGGESYTWTNAAPITLDAGQTYNLPLSVSAAPPAPTSINGHACVDMGEVTIGGVNKHLYWADCNLGAANPWDYGDLYAWGEKAPKSDYTFANYLGTAYDAATEIWAGDWRTPSYDEWAALLDTNFFSWDWQENYKGTGKNGVLVTRKPDTGPCAGNSIFLPAGGYSYGQFGWSDANTNGDYMSSTLSEGAPNEKSWHVKFSSTKQILIKDSRIAGHSVRPVAD